MISLNLPWPPKELNPNQRLHWAKLANAKKKYRHDCRVLGLATGRKIAGRHHLSVTFFPPDKRLRDRDNLLASMKSGLDGVADALGINDREFDPITVSLGEPSKRPHVHITLTPHEEAV